MLSALEFATLMLVRDAADRIASRDELAPLLERQLIAREQPGGTSVLQLTPEGALLLGRLGPIH
ncbi:hypothetical protein [Paraburkholderia acidipaludis]|uniref:hypothetical protein n=1 Tax=Paraburkholderia acidipaludis TaxID=660537 RepID=UPI00047FBE1E|nr:hypothetical protein [Paraburkholderia acidipaludis]